MCSAHAAVRHLLDGMVEDNVVTVVDMEAGLEHLSRGTDRNVDVLVVVAEPYFKALETARRCCELGRELGIPRVVAVANKFRSDSDLEAVRNFALKHSMPLIAEIPFDESIQKADVAGTAAELRTGSTAVAAISKIADELGLAVASTNR